MHFTLIYRPRGPLARKVQSQGQTAFAGVGDPGEAVAERLVQVGQTELIMPVAFTPNEEAQLAQTIEMFEVITQSQPLDYQSLEILKEAYSKMGRLKEAVRTSKRIAEAYVHLGQLSSAILEYESILQRVPGDPDVQKALTEIELKANNLAEPARDPVDRPPAHLATFQKKSEQKSAPVHVDDGRQAMHSLFVGGRIIGEDDFNRCWPAVHLHESPKQPVTPFVQVLVDQQLMPIEACLKLLVEKARLPFLPIEQYEVDVELARSFSRDSCLRWCVLPFDRMSKSILVATANPFNKQVVAELESWAKARLLWYIAGPAELSKLLKKVFR